MGKARCLLVLDGLEPLQHPPGPMQGQIKDPALSALLKGLAAQNAGLCVVTTREQVVDIGAHYSRTADDFELTYLDAPAGAALLHHAGATRAGAKAIEPDDAELRAASREVRGHGLTLQLLGQYLKLAADGDVRKRDSVRLEDADLEYQNDATRPYGHAFKAMEAYEKWFEGEGEAGLRQLAVLRLLGLFDRPAPADCLDALLKLPEIPGLTEPLFATKTKSLGVQRTHHPIAEREWRVTLAHLESAKLVAMHRDETRALVALDAHPLLREYFGRQLREKRPDSWRAAHRRLYEHLYATTKEGEAPTLEDLQPLYQAVAHGCHAGLEEEALDSVYYARIHRREAYAIKKLGAFGSDLGAVACFFETPWKRVSPAFAEDNQAWLLAEAALHLRALGRLTEAVEPMRAGLSLKVRRADWTNAAIAGSNLSELELTLGDVARALTDAEQSVTYADRSGAGFQRITKRATHADALHQAGRPAEAEALFREAEQMQAEARAEYPLLYSLQGFRYCDFLLGQAERDAWQALLDGGRRQDALASCRAVSERAAQTIKIAESNKWLLDIALDHLTLGRAALYEAVLSGEWPGGFAKASTHLCAAVDGLRRAGTQDHLPRGLLTRAWLRAVLGKRTGVESAQEDLDEGWEIAARGPMPLFQVDIHLYRARLFGKPGDGRSTPGTRHSRTSRRPAD